ncbi:hypothetical protein AA313_de0203777 [Arthrobotrys entomopaga]|nr:hypothetical protein AA313_de0203777 [Arthrobotrys entomopaga]
MPRSYYHLRSKSQSKQGLPSESAATQQTRLSQLDNKNISEMSMSSKSSDESATKAWLRNWPEELTLQEPSNSPPRLPGWPHKAKVTMDPRKSPQGDPSHLQELLKAREDEIEDLFNKAMLYVDMIDTLKARLRTVKVQRNCQRRRVKDLEEVTNRLDRENRARRVAYARMVEDVDIIDGKLCLLHRDFAELVRRKRAFKIED